MNDPARSAVPLRADAAPGVDAPVPAAATRSVRSRFMRSPVGWA